MRALVVVGLVCLMSCGHPWRNAAIINSTLTGAAAVCAFDCGNGVARPVADVVLVIEAAALAALAPIGIGLTGLAVGEEGKR